MAETGNDSPNYRPETLAVRAGVVVLGLEVLAESPRAAGVPVVVVAWEPPAGGDERLARIVAGLL